MTRNLSLAVRWRRLEVLVLQDRWHLAVAQQVQKSVATDVTLLNLVVRFTPESGQRPHGIYEYTP
jgi:hypothetical protein